MKRRADRQVGLSPDTALCRSALYEALALGFRRPEDELVDVLNDGARREGLLSAANALDKGLHGLAADVFRIGAGSSQPMLTDTYDRIFGHTARGVVSPFEVEYGEKDIFQQPQELADVGGFYRAFGLEIRPETVLRLDHVSCECEFMAFLARKEAYAAEVGDRDMLAEVSRTERLFLRDHLGRFGLAFSYLLTEAEGGFYGSLGRLTASFLEWECRRHDVRPGPRKLKVEVWKEAAVPTACGGCPTISPPGDAGPAPTPGGWTIKAP
jgi:TorA maturation chaperone TorD